MRTRSRKEVELLSKLNRFATNRKITAKKYLEMYRLMGSGDIVDIQSVENFVNTIK